MTFSVPPVEPQGGALHCQVLVLRAFAARRIDVGGAGSMVAQFAPEPYHMADTVRARLVQLRSVNASVVDWPGATVLGWNAHRAMRTWQGAVVVARD